MDIPVPEKNESKDGEKVSVAVVSSAKSEPQPATTSTAPKPADALSTVEEKNKQIVDLVTSKKYVFAIKEKRSSPIITLGFIKTKDRKNRRSTRTTTKSSTNTVKKADRKVGNFVKVGVLILLCAGAYLAVDAGLIDIGFELPISFIGEES
jgi:hypothetical protein